MGILMVFMATVKKILAKIHYNLLLSI